jgi:hypothetical protein
MEAAVLESVEVNDNQEPERIKKDGYFLERRGFGAGAAEGFEFYVIQFDNLGAATAKYGEDRILALINSSLAFSLRQKAKNKLPNPEGKSKDEVAALVDQQRERGETLLLTTEEIEEYQPGERGLSSPESMLKEAKKLAKDAAKETNAERKATLLKEAKELRAKAVAIISASLDSE